MSICDRVTSVILSLLWRYSSLSSGKNSRAESLRPLLRRFPFWIDGHQLLAEESLLHDNVACAYGSALCMLALEPRAAATAVQANFILGRCYLRRGDWATAHEHLKEALRLSPSNTAILEEDAAALILGGELRQARALLDQIPQHSLSAAGKSARAFLHSKVSTQ
jgi:tetratricopeptide (TPR) repeat protein